jgi:hypothetical protein
MVRREWRDDGPRVSGLLVWDEPGRIPFRVHSILEREPVSGRE